MDRSRRPTLEQYDELKSLPGYAGVQERLERARSLVSYTDECLTDTELGDVSAGVQPTEEQAKHISECKVCRELIEVASKHRGDPAFVSRMLAAFASADDIARSEGCSAATCSLTSSEQGAPAHLRHDPSTSGLTGERLVRKAIANVLVAVAMKRDVRAAVDRAVGQIMGRDNDSAKECGGVASGA